MLHAGAGHGKPETHVDEQPAGSVAGGRDKSAPASDVRRRSGAVPQLVDTAPHDGILDRWVLVHCPSFRQELLSQDYLSQELLSSWPRDYPTASVASTASHPLRSATRPDPACGQRQLTTTTFDADENTNVA
jgi:hypothetical protein